MGNNKSTPIIIIGVAIFIIGGAALLLVLGGGKSSKKSSASTGSLATTTTTPGSVALAAGTGTATTLPSTVVIPAGDNALDVQMEYFAGGGGFVQSGALVNIYTVLNKDCATPNFPLTVALVKSNVKVIEALGSGPGQTGNSGSFLLAVTPQDAQSIIFFQKLGSLFFTLTSGSQPAVATAPVSCGKAP